MQLPDEDTAIEWCTDGSDDMLLTLAHGRHTAEVVPGAVLHVLPGHGHLTVLSEIPSAVTRLAR